ncbi:small rab-related GTPase [Dunaliella salina]|uniref:Small rab-related GTPase n=1 Tax=Dunaliella salina TaxID=3046 RepID=A0ABQ7GRV8_DUNSA|nr:small rab-related GTPase [Dunaliella salina]|eukprot:KAF5837319.1 small rab-related GTPase [Dunaliella salina]
MEDFDREIKVLVVGDGGVGKTSMIRRFCKGMFTDEYKKTIGVDFMEKPLFVDKLGEEVRFMLWDTAGQEEFNSITRVYYRGAGAAVIAFATNDRASFDAVASWKDKIEAECGEVAIALVQNKVDLVHQSAMTAEEVEGLARKLGCKLYRTCVKEDINVTEVFVYLAELHDKKMNSGRLGMPPQRPVAFSGASLQGSSPGAGSSPSAQQQADGQEGDGVQQPQQQVLRQVQSPTPQAEAKTVELRPNKERGKKKKGVGAKMSQC